MKPPCLTVKQINEACQKHRYILLREASGYLMGVNTGCAAIARKRKKHKDSDKACFIGLIPCNLNEYINHKHPFL